MAWPKAMACGVALSILVFTRPSCVAPHQVPHAGLPDVASPKYTHPDTKLPPLQELIAVEGSLLIQLQDVLTPAVPRGLRWWTPGAKRFLCLAVDDPDLIPDELEPPSLLRFYEQEEQGLRLRYVYHCDMPFVAFSYFPTARRKLDDIDENLLVVMAPHKGIPFVAFGLHADRLQRIWECASYPRYDGWPEFADIDGDDVQEVVMWYPNDQFDPDPHPDATAEVYKELNGLYRLVEKTSYKNRLLPRPLPSDPLPEDWDNFTRGLG